MWDPKIIWLHVLSDGLITLAYYSIPVTFVFFLSRRRDVPFRTLFWLFAMFIMSCGTTHLLEIYTVWHGTYILTGAVKAITACLYLAAATTLAYIMPRLLQLRSPEQLEALNQNLARQILETQATQFLLRTGQSDLEKKIVERTTQLQEINHRLEQEIISRRQADERFRLAVDASPTATLMSDAQGRIALANARAARAYAEAKGWRVLEVYRLDAVSGKAVMQHPEAKRMLADIRDGTITGLVFSKLARLARNTKELLEQYK